MAIKSGQRSSVLFCISCYLHGWPVGGRNQIRSASNDQRKADLPSSRNTATAEVVELLWIRDTFCNNSIWQTPTHRPTGIVKLHLRSERNTALNNCYRNDRKGQTDRRWTIGHDEDTGQQIVR